MRLKIGILSLVIALVCIGCSCGKKGEESASHTESSSVFESVGISGSESDSSEESESGTESTGESEEESGVEEGPSADDNELPIITDPDLD